MFFAKKIITCAEKYLIDYFCRMLKFKKIVYVLVIGLMFSSCGDYQRVLNKGNAKERYKLATTLYEQQKYNKALRLLEKLTVPFAGKPQMERIQYMIANANFNLKDYGLSAYYFDKFAKNYPKSSKKDDAIFLSALSYYKSSPSYSLDPTDTEKAITVFQNYIDSYPNSPRIEEANKYYKELRFKLEKKAFEIAKTYYRTAEYDSRNYKAAIVAFDNLLSDFLGTRFKEEALYYRFKAAHDFAIKSTFRRKPVRIKEAVEAYNKLDRNFPNSKFKKDSNVMLSRLQDEEKRIQSFIKG